jgi:raffinose/stachyose/melibiose transport system substrate-binding protein
MKVISAKVAVAALACSVLAACTGGAPASNDDSASGADAKTITWLIEEPEDASALKALKAHVATFEKQSGITVKTSTLPFENMRTVLQTQLRSGEGPDVFNWGSGPSFGGALAKSGLLYDLTDAYAKYHWKVYDFAKERVTTDGKVYGIPGELETIGLFYNKELFAKLGLEPPTTLAELEAVSRKVRAVGKTPMAVSDKEGWEGGHLLSMALSSAIGPGAMEQLLAGKKSWNSPEVVDALDTWKRFDQQGYLPKSPTSVDYDTATASFYSGDAAMIPTGSWLVGEIDDNAKFDAGYIPFPGPKGAGIFTGGLGSGPFVSATSKKKPAALQFLNFLASEQHGAWTVENLHTIPPQPLDTSKLDVSPLFAQVLKDTAAIGNGKGFGYNIDVLASDATNKAMYDGVQAVLTGQQSAREVAATMQTASQR